MLRSSGAFEFEISGGTHNPMAPPFGFLDACFLPILRRMGADVQVDLERPGFFPAGGGRIRARISPSRPHPLELLERGREGRHRSHLGLAHLPAEILQREIQTLAEGLHWPNNRFIEEDVSSSAGPGNILDVRLEFEHITHVLTQFGAPGVGGIGLAKQLVNKTRSYLRGSAPVGTQLADQLMLPMAFLAGGRFRAYHVDDHGTSNAEVIEQFAPGTVTIHERGREGVLVEVNPLFPA
ncbi:MAG: RNA 3'-terminal phosphate cyclase [Planctomycetota bacterium]